MRTLHLWLINNDILSIEWGIDAYIVNPTNGRLFIRCNKKGKVNWHRAPVYREKDVIDALIRGRKVIVLN